MKIYKFLQIAICVVIAVSAAVGQDLTLENIYAKRAFSQALEARQGGQRDARR